MQFIVCIKFVIISFGLDKMSGETESLGKEEMLSMIAGCVFSELELFFNFGK